MNKNLVPFLKNNAGKLLVLVLVAAAIAWLVKKILTRNPGAPLPPRLK